MPLDATPIAGEGTVAGETRVELKQPITDEYSAASALEGILDFDASHDDGDDTGSGASASDAGTGESQSTGEEEGQSETEDGGEPPAPASIEPPKSWPQEDRAVFSKLPPEAQAIIARREGERDSILLQKGEEIANERKGWDAERTAIATQRTQYEQNLQQLIQIAVPEAQAFAQIDWPKLSIENPVEYVRLSAARDQLRGRIGAVQAELQRVQQAQNAERQQRHQAFLGEQKTRLAEKVPDFADPVKGPKLAADMRDWLQTQGFNGDEIGQVADHRLVALAVKAMRAHQAEAARKAADTKRANPAPTVQRPGNAGTADEGATRRMRDKVQNFGRSNSVRDAASILMDIL